MGLKTVGAQDAAQAGGTIERRTPGESRGGKPQEALQNGGQNLRCAEPLVPVRPFVKWAGGKGRLLHEIRGLYPLGLGEGITKYAEPFVGGGAVLCDILSRYRLDAVYIGDTNAELINAYRVIRDEPERLIALLMRLQGEYFPMDAGARAVYYYAARARYNRLIQSGGAEDAQRAALFIFLNKTCFNGLHRVNRRGLFNVPMGAYQNPAICDGENLANLSRALNNVTIVCGDYRESAGFIDANTFVYFDPPYRPLPDTSSFTAYTESPFGDEQQRELARFVGMMSRRGAKVVVSNSDPKNSDGEDDFFDELYADHRIRRIGAARMINCDGKARGKVSELLISDD